MYENILTFYSKSKNKNVRQLSNFHIEKIILEDKEFNSGEHCFHYFKYFVIAKSCNDIERYNELITHSIKIQNTDTPVDAKKLGSKSCFKLTNEELNVWGLYSIQYQNKICLEKLKQNENVKNILLETHNKYLLHQENRANMNSLWGGRIKDNELIGKNQLGKIWMSLRDNIKQLE